MSPTVSVDVKQHIEPWFGTGRHSLSLTRQPTSEDSPNSLLSMTRSHRWWFITKIWKSDHRLNITLGTDIKFTFSFLSAKSVLMKYIFALFQDSKASKRGQFEYKWASSFTHLGHFDIPRQAITLKQLLNCVFLFTIYVPRQSPAPLPKLRLTRVRMHEFSQSEGIPSGTEALRWHETCEFKLKEEKIKRIFAYLAHLCTFMYLLSDPY